MLPRRTARWPTMTLDQNAEKQQNELRLRSKPVERPFHVVLVEPEIPPNTGNVARLCAATRSPLHLVGKLGFRIDEHAVRRAGLDYWHLVDVQTHETLLDAEAAIDRERPFGRTPRRYFFSGHAERSYLDVQFELGDILIFGKESVGLPESLLEQRAEEVIGIPMSGLVRSHNLANSVAIALYEALRQTGVLATTTRGA
jgi:tRNA (cytidine/uridine-2'-O-)-methyltransferase